MIYEHRSYTLTPATKTEFIEAFGKLMPLFDKYGAKVIGVWQTDIGESNEFIYIVAFENFTQREEFWPKFRVICLSQGLSRSPFAKDWTKWDCRIQGPGARNEGSITPLTNSYSANIGPSGTLGQLGRCVFPLIYHFPSVRGGFTARWSSGVCT